MPTGSRQARSGASGVSAVAAVRSDEIHDRVRADIVHGVLRPNQRLVEVELAERLAVSRTPVRETLQRLVLEGLVRRDRRGWVVHEHSAEEISSIYEVRAALEGYAAFLAAGRATAGELRRARTPCTRRAMMPWRWGPTRRSSSTSASTTA